jgi:DNA (cytosine-5)-methyltransferase 1
MNGLIVDLFAGGGGASLGVEMGLERTVDIAINHDPEAIAMHRANHPWTRHYVCDIHEVDPVEACQGKPVDFMWASPDCTHHSKAKGGKPRDKKLRFLAWTVVEWARKVRPAVICLENVEEFQDWGPLDDDGQPIRAMKGIIFQSFVKALRGLGYGVDWRQLKACDYGAPTTRKRLFLVARADGSAPVWPEPTHGMGRIPYRTAAECIDWSIPCPSIFDRKKPLAEATCKRIAKGIAKFVLENPRPFIVQIAHYNGNNIVQDSLDPLRTITSATKGGEFALAMPHITKYNTGSIGSDCREPLKTIVAGGRNPSHPGGCAPVGLVSAFLAKHYGGVTGQGAADPLGTVTAIDHHSLVAASLVRQFGASTGSDVDEPMGAVMPGGSGKTQLATAYLTRYNGQSIGQTADDPIGTVDSTERYGLAAPFLAKLKGTCRHGQGVETPMATIGAQGQHMAAVSAFLLKYYGTNVGFNLTDPAQTVTSKDRFGLVTVTLDGEPYVIADIGLRMLKPRELFRAQGFPDNYVIDPEMDGKRLSQTAQVRMVGNSVCPPVAAALPRANVREAVECGIR